MSRFVLAGAVAALLLGLMLGRSVVGTAAPPLAYAVASSCAGDFTQPASSPEAVGASPYAVAAGDFNLDGIPDLAVANAFDNTVSILLGDGAGDFTAAPTSPESVGAFPDAIAVADFNRDGGLDLAVANENSNTVSILLGDGTGNFNAAPSSPKNVGTNPTSVAVGDFDGDGKLDLAVTNYSSNNVTILLGDGTGNFSESVFSPIAVGSFPQIAVAGDFNADGKLDLAVTNNGDNTVTILLGTGTGNFTDAATSPESVGSTPIGATVGDFNGDGKLDLAVNNANDNTVSILLGDGTGNFTAAATSPESVGSNPKFVASADFNRDGLLDLAVTNGNASSVSILLGDGTGNFTAAATSPESTGGGPAGIAVADFNLDGKPDLATANYGFQVDTVSILLNACPATLCSGNFTAAATSPESVGTNPLGETVGDFNGDGFPDLAVVNSGSNTVSILLGSATGDFTAAATSPESVGTLPAFAATGDFNRDGKLDLAVVNQISNNVSILLGDGTGNFTAAATSPESVGNFPKGVAVGDFNRDGKLDLAVANSGDNNVRILLGDGTGNFTAAATSPESVGNFPNSVAVGDFDLDGTLDLAVDSYFDGNVSILLGDGTGNFTAAATSPESAGVGPVKVAVGDFNGDGKLDLAVLNQSGGTVSILLGDGTGNFTAAATSPESVGASPNSVAVGDFNGDGKLDLAVTNGSNNTVSILLGDGTGNFSAAATSPEGTGTLPYDVAVGDFNRDGLPDLAVVNYSSNSVSILLNSCAAPSTATPTVTATAPATSTATATATGTATGTATSTATATGTPTATATAAATATTTPTPTATPGGGWTVVAVADFNGDNKGDLRWRHVSTGQDAVWLMNGFAINSQSVTSIPNGWSVVGVGDFDGDGKDDLFGRNASTGENAVWLMNGFAISGQFVSSVPAPWTVVAVADFDGDGKSDLFWRNPTTGEDAVWLMNGFTLTGQFVTTVPSAWSVVGVGDFDGDGKSDLFWRNAATGEDAIWLMNGFAVNGQFVTTVPTLWTVVTVADFDGDGKSDLFWRNPTTGENAIWLMNGFAINGQFVTSAPSEWSVVGVGDFDGNGKRDLFWRNATTGEDGVWLMNGFTLSAQFVSSVPAPWTVVAATDFDGDGKSDLFWRNQTTGDNVIWLMNGFAINGQFVTNMPGG